VILRVNSLHKSPARLIGKLNRLSAAFPIITLRKISDDSLRCAATKVARNIRQKAVVSHSTNALQLLCETGSKRILVLFQTEGWPGDARSTRAAIFAGIRLLVTLFLIFFLDSFVEMDKVGGFTGPTARISAEGTVSPIQTSSGKARRLPQRSPHIADITVSARPVDETALSNRFGPSRPR
jgi:hypothetical protein